MHDLGQFCRINKTCFCCEDRDVELHGFSENSGKVYGPVCLFG